MLKGGGNFYPQHLGDGFALVSGLYLCCRLFSGIEFAFFRDSFLSTSEPAPALGLCLTENGVVLRFAARVLDHHVEPETAFLFAL